MQVVSLCTVKDAVRDLPDLECCGHLDPALQTPCQWHASHGIPMSQGSVRLLIFL